MYSKTQLTFKYIQYYLTALNGKGHGIHSPFVYDFVKNVLNDDREFYAFKPIEQQRGLLKLDEKLIAITKRKSNFKSVKYGRLLFRMVNYFGSKSILNLHTTLGIEASYLASANQSSTVTVLEQEKAIIEIAKKTLFHLNLSNINIIEGNFRENLPFFLSNSSPVDFVFFNGNQSQNSIQSYYPQILKHCSQNTVIVFHDIATNKEMENAWHWVKENTQLCITINLFYVGIVFLSPNFKIKQHFTIRF